MVLKCSCGKVWRIKDDAKEPKCPSCGARLQRSTSSAQHRAVPMPTPAPSDERLKALEKELTDIKGKLQDKDKTLETAQSKIADLQNQLASAQTEQFLGEHKEQDRTGTWSGRSACHTCRR